MKDYFNTLEFNKASDLKWVNPMLSIKLFEEYIKKYPTDYSSYPFYIDLLINYDKLNKANDVLNKVISMIKKDYRYQRNQDKMKHLQYGLIYNKIRLLLINKDYQQTMDLVTNYKDNLMNIDKGLNITGIIFYCKKQLGLLDINRRENNCYLFRQILDYHEDDFIDHIKKHLYIGEEENLCLFSETFPFNKILSEIKKNIPSDKRLRSGYFDDKYFFKYDECGRCDYKITDYFEVITLMDSNDFITMYPANVNENIPYIDLNYLKEEKTLVKRESQIDKFNKRYHR